MAKWEYISRSSNSVYSSETIKSVRKATPLIVVLIDLVKARRSKNGGCFLAKCSHCTGGTLHYVKRKWPIVKCFSCGYACVDGITFVKEYLKTSFPEAMYFCADRYAKIRIKPEDTLREGDLPF